MTIQGLEGEGWVGDWSGGWEGRGGAGGGRGGRWKEWEGGLSEVAKWDCGI